MGPTPLLGCLLWAAMFYVTAAQTPKFLIIAPRVLHLGVQEQVWVQMEWDTNQPRADIKVDLYLRNQRNMQSCSKGYTVTLTNANNFISKVNVELTSSMASTCQHQEQKALRYVQLVAKSTVLGKDLKVVSIPVTYKRGYIFIQTDKSVYTPKEKVQFRMFALDHQMKPVKDTIISTVTNAEGLRVKKNQKTTEGSVVSDSLNIPDISTPGTWRISAYFPTAPESNFTAEFEVKKYVLPNYEVKIIPELPYFLITKKDFTIKVEARYVYGESVDGVAYVRVGIIDQQGTKTLLQGLEQQVKMEDGAGTVRIKMDDIKKKINQALENLAGSTFYIAASVMEKASGNLEEKEITTVKFVASPYNLDLSKTKRFFNPGTPAKIVAEVTLSDGSPAWGISVTLLGSNNPAVSLNTNKDGMVVLPVNTNKGDRSLDFKVRVVGDDGRLEETLTLTPYTSASNSFLNMDIPIQVLNPRETLKVEFKVVSPNVGSVKAIYYMILNKGQILSLKSVTNSELTAVDIPVDYRMIPSFRIIAYYYLGNEIVANSAWVDVTDVCEGKLEIRTNVADYTQPGSSIKLTVEGPDKMTVYLSAVDTAVYLVNSKNKLTPSKVFKTMNEYDLGCSPGGGRDSKAVFMDAGVAYVSSASFSDHRANRFASEHLRKCCTNGMTLLPPRMDRDCAKRARRVENGDCRNAFLDCCKYAEDLRKQIALERRKQHTIGRTQEDQEEEDFTDENDVQVRSKFAETWLWSKKRSPDATWRCTGTSWCYPFMNKAHNLYCCICCSAILNDAVPDSITTWEIQGVGISPENGFCVAQPVNLRVFKEFHIYLKVPYSVKRFEQIELRPVLHNYHDIDVKVKVFVDQSEGICSPRTSDGGVVQRDVTVGKNSALAIPFSVVPIGKDIVTVTVKALGQFGISDAVQKFLRIEKEGVEVIEEKTYVVDGTDPKRNEITISEDLPPNIIPDGDFRSSVKIVLDSSIDTINTTLSPDGVSKLIRVPYGCAEQTMISTAPGVYAMRYLDHTNKWIMLPPDRKDQGLTNMQNGYSRILNYRKLDGSYGAWLHRTSSTWLTAFVLKVMSLCRKYIDVDVQEIRRSAHYLISKQTSTGAFQETLQVIHTDMMGGVTGHGSEVSLTAYVLIALYHSQDSLAEDDNTVKGGMSKAIDYLRKALDTVSDPYPLAISAYALNLASRDSVLKDRAYFMMKSTAQEVPGKSELYFGPEGTALAVETTSYALLVALLRNDLDSARKMYTWLSEQKNYGSGFKSTQDTVMALEALSEYWIKTFKDEPNELQVEINSLERSQTQRVILRNEDSVQEELRSMGTKFKVKVHGKGNGILTVLKRYNILKVDNSDCSQLGLEVKVYVEDKVIPNPKIDFSQKSVFEFSILPNLEKLIDGLSAYLSQRSGRRSFLSQNVPTSGFRKMSEDPGSSLQWKSDYNDYYDNLDDGEDEASDEPLSSIHWHDLRMRARREVSQPKEKQVIVTYEACLWRKANGASGMVIVDITMLSGFEANKHNLNKLKEDSERYISHYEIHGGRVLLYLDQVSRERYCVTFEALQMVKIAPLQPASAILYDFYEPDNQCRVFYNVPSRTSFISTLCSGNVCQCAEGFHGTVTDVKQEDAFIVYLVKIVDVLQTIGKHLHITWGPYPHNLERVFSSLGEHLHITWGTSPHDLGNIFTSLGEHLHITWETSSHHLGNIFTSLGKHLHITRGTSSHHLGNISTSLGKHLHITWETSSHHLGNTFTSLGKHLHITWGTSSHHFGEHLHIIWGTSSHHLGNIFTTLGEHLHNTWGTSSQHLGNIFTTLGEHLHNTSHHLGNIFTSLGEHLHIIWETFSHHLGNISTSLGEHLHIIWGTSSHHLGNISPSFRKHLHITWETSSHHSRNIFTPLGEHLHITWETSSHHLGNIFTSLGEHLHITWETSSHHLGNIFTSFWGTSSHHLGNIFTSLEEHLHNTWGTSSQHLGNIFTTLGEHLHNTWGTSSQHITSLGEHLHITWGTSETSSHHLENIFTTLGEHLHNTWETSSQHLGNIFTTLGEHLHNTWGTSSQHLGNIFTTLGEHLHNTWGTSSHHLGNIFTSLGEHLHITWGTSSHHLGNFFTSLGEHLHITWGTSSKHLGNIFTTLGEHLHNTWGTSSQHLGNIFTTLGEHLHITWETSPHHSRNIFTSLAEHLHITWETTSYHLGNIFTSLGEHLQITWGTSSHHLGNIFTSLGEHLHITWETSSQHLGNIFTTLGEHLHITWGTSSHHLGNIFTSLGEHFHITWKIFLREHTHQTSLKRNADESIKAGDTRSFYQRAACQMRLEKKDYLIMGKDGETKDEKGRMRYFIEDNSWLEEIATPEACRASRLRNKCADINTFMENYKSNGCKV
ncbi:complement C4-B-like [Gastrophryne carolinensis]